MPLHKKWETAKNKKKKAGKCGFGQFTAEILNGKLIFLYSDAPGAVSVKVLILVTVIH